MGKLAPLTRDTTDSPTVTVPFTYYVTDFENESNIGLKINNDAPNTTSVLSTIIDKTTDEKNYFILVSPDGIDAITRSGAVADEYVLGIGNGIITNYSLEASVGDYPTVNVTIEGLNLRGLVGTTGVTGTQATWFPSPAINPQNGTQISATNTNFKLPAGSIGNPGKPSVLKPGDISITFAESTLFATKIADLNIQSFNLSFDLAREPIESLGFKYAKTRELTFPLDFNFTMEALAGDFQTGNLRSIVCNEQIKNATITLRKPDCENNGAVNGLIELKGLSLQSEAFSVDAEGNQTVSITWLGSIGDKADLANNIFMSGKISYT
jgi:hypothetical protein